jgi:hypothetical protein
MTRTGKIARLPHQIRDQLNHRLLDGEKAKVIVPWLNNLPEVLSILTSEFSGRPINSVNLTEWKNGGFRDWLVRQEALKMVHNLSDDETVADKSLKDKFTAQLAHWVALHLAATAQVVIAPKRIRKSNGPDSASFAQPSIVCAAAILIPNAWPSITNGSPSKNQIPISNEKKIFGNGWNALISAKNSSPIKIKVSPRRLSPKSNANSILCEKLHPQ